MRKKFYIISFILKTNFRKYLLGARASQSYERLSQKNLIVVLLYLLLFFASQILGSFPISPYWPQTDQGLLVTLIRAGTLLG